MTGQVGSRFPRAATTADTLSQRLERTLERERSWGLTHGAMITLRLSLPGPGFKLEAAKAGTACRSNMC
jgi:hypothetical protein